MLKRFLSLLVAMLLLLAPLSALARGASAPSDEDEPVMIHTIELFGFTPPVWGAHPDYELTVPEGQGYYLDFSTWWFYVPETGDVGRIWEDGVFNDPSALYYQDLEIRVYEGYDIADDVSVLIDGSAEYVDSHCWSFNAPLYHVYTVEFGVSAPDFVPGDCDGDQSVTATDAVLALRHAMGLTVLEGSAFLAGDMDANGAVSISDAVIILRMAMGLTE